MSELPSGNAPSVEAGDATKRDEFTPEEILSLKAMAHEPKRAWWRNHPFLLSVLAFVLSLVTSIASVYTSYRKDINDQLAQLTAAIQTIQELNLKQVEIHEKYKGTVYESQAGGFITAQINNTLVTASDLAFRVGTHATTAALIPIAQGLYGLGDYAKSENLLQTALGLARSANDESVALRNLGFLKITTGKTGKSLQEGEELYLRALNIDRKYDLTQLPANISWLKAMANLDWAGALARVDCNEARKHFAEAVDTLNSATQTIDLDQLRGSARFHAGRGLGGSPACLPGPGIPAVR